MKKKWLSPTDALNPSSQKILRLKPVIFIFGLFLLGAIPFLWNLGSIGLVDETEPLFAEAARQMTVTGDWITPYFNGKQRFDKPILIYWLIAWCYHLLGVNEWAARLPSALSAICLMFFLFFSLKSFGYNCLSKDLPTHRSLWWTGGLGAAIFAFNPLIVAWGRIAVSDMLLTACMAGSLLCFFWGYVESEKQNIKPHIDQFPNKWYLGFYILLALGVLTKGPVGVVLPGLIIMAFLLYVGNLKLVIQEMGIFWGLVIFAIISLPWYVLVTLQNGSAFIDSFFGYHNLERFTNVVNRHSAPWYFYFLIVLGGFFPYSIYLPLAISRVKFWQRNIWRRQPRYGQFSLFALFWFLVVFLFFTIAVTKLPSYVIPLFPASAILIACLWSENLPSHPQAKSVLTSGINNVIFLVLMVVAAVFLPYFLGPDNATVNLSQSITESGLTWRSGWVWGLTAIAVCYLLTRGYSLRWLLGANLAGFVAFFIFCATPGLFLMDSVRQLPLREVSILAAQIKQPGEDLLMIGFKKPSVAFYSQSLITYADSKNDLNVYLETNAKKSPPTVLMIGRTKDLLGVGVSENHYQNLATKGVYNLVRVDKGDLGS